jgi:hypothetical protein
VLCVLRITTNNGEETKPSRPTRQHHGACSALASRPSTTRHENRSKTKRKAHHKKSQLTIQIPQPKTHRQSKQNGPLAAPQHFEVIGSARRRLGHEVFVRLLVDCVSHFVISASRIGASDRASWVNRPQYSRIPSARGLLPK